MDATAKLSHVRISPKKMRLVADLIRGKHIEDALNQLQFSDKKAAKILSKVIKSAMANAERIGNIDVDNLFVKKLLINKGPDLKRFMPRAMGRANRILHRTSHVVVELGD